MYNYLISVDKETITIASKKHKEANGIKKYKGGFLSYFNVYKIIVVKLF